MQQDGPGYFYIVPKRGDAVEVWMWDGHNWYAPGDPYVKDQPFWSHKVPEPPRPADPDHWHVTLDGYGANERGDVVTKHGEIIGTWVLDAEDHPAFIPLGETEEIIWSPWVGEFCKRVAEWHEQREAQK